MLWRIRLVIVGRFVISGERVLKDRDLSSVFFFELVDSVDQLVRGGFLLKLLHGQFPNSIAVDRQLLARG